MKNPKPFLFIVSGLLALGLISPASAALKWEQTTLDLYPAVGDKDAVGHFKYQNTGDKPVRFKSVRTSCGCTVAQTQKDVVPPGEKGEITATFHIGDRTGAQMKTVIVETDDSAPSVTLTLKATIPQLLEIKPTFVFWQANESPTAKTVNVTASKDFPVPQIKVTSSNPDFQTKVEKVGKGEFKIDIQPKTMTKPSSTALTIQPENSSKVFNVSASVMAAPVVPAVVNPAATWHVVPTPAPVTPAVPQP